jgi:hypothetical protein
LLNWKEGREGGRKEGRKGGRKEGGKEDICGVAEIRLIALTSWIVKCKAIVILYL